MYEVEKKEILFQSLLSEVFKGSPTPSFPKCRQPRNLGKGYEKFL
jgi:hypothetical protein